MYKLNKISGFVALPIIIGSAILVVGVLGGLGLVSGASLISLDLKVNGQSESVLADLNKGDVLTISWTTSGSEQVLGCGGTGVLGYLTYNGVEWAGNSTLPALGTVNLVLTQSEPGSLIVSMYCWTKNPSDTVIKNVIVSTPSSLGIGKGQVPIITSLTPSGGPVGTLVTINGSGFTNNNHIVFVGSSNVVSGMASGTVSPLDGEISFKNINSVDGKTLTFVIPSVLSQYSEGGTLNHDVMPGIYYVVVSTDNGKSGVSYFKVGNKGETLVFVPPTVPFVINNNLKFGDLGSSVTQLQGLLVGDSNIKPKVLITGYFGLSTEEAVQSFQCKYLSICSGTRESGYGVVDINTRFKLEEMYLLNKLDYALVDGNIDASEARSLLLDLDSYLK